MMPIEFRGLGEFSAAISNLTNTGDLKDSTTRAMADKLLEKAKYHTPVLTGALQSSGSVQRIDGAWHVVFSTPYAAMQHETDYDRRAPAWNQWVLRAAARYGDEISGAGKVAAEGTISGKLLAAVAGRVIRGLR